MNTTNSPSQLCIANMRPATPLDLPAIIELLDLAFAPSQYESRLITAFMKNERPLHHWAIESDGVLAAYICYSRAYREQTPIGFHLAPVAVHPKRQKQGFGTKIIRDTLALLPIADSSVFALGAPAFYTKFGFRGIAQPQCPFDPGNEHFMALRYDALDPFQVGYEREFMDGQ